MSSRFRVAMGGVSEVVGLRLIHQALHQPQIRLVALTLGEIEMPRGSRMEVFIADADRWSRVMKAMRPKVFIVGLGPALNLAGRDDSPLRAIEDEEAVVEIAKTARFAGVERLIAISAEGADRWSRDRHLSAKGKAEAELARLGFKRLDIIAGRKDLARWGQAGSTRRATWSRDRCADRGGSDHDAEPAAHPGQVHPRGGRDRARCGDALARSDGQAGDGRGRRRDG